MTAAPRHQVVAGGLVLDGEGGVARPLDVYLIGDRIAELRTRGGVPPGWTAVDATGLTVAPGFIDVHSHADNAPLLADDDTTKLLQGVTSEVVGNCGQSLAPVPRGGEAEFSSWVERLFPPMPLDWHDFGEFLATTDQRGAVVNVAPLVGHSALRVAVMGFDARPPTPTELNRMGELLDDALAAGAFGMSTGLIYPPGVFSDTAELVALARHLGPDRVYASHIRGEADTLVASVQEVVDIAQQAGCRAQVSHHKATGRRNWGRTEVTLGMLAAARAGGIRVRQDVYPYTASSTTLSALLPPQLHAGGEQALLRRLADEAALQDLEHILAAAEPIPGWENALASCGWDGIMIATTPDHRFEGETIASVMETLGMAGPGHAVAHVLREERLQVTAVFFGEMSEDDLVRVLQDPHTMIGSDGLPPGGGGLPHPRLTGTFPRVLGTYVRERGVLSLPEAVRRMTSLPATHFGLQDRGVVRPGLIADLVAFDPDTVGDRGGYREPLTPPAGIAWVMLAGEVAAADGRILPGRHGRRLLPCG
ncbi:MAG TPA: D-aminoacylase [Verrucomicrobiae bacterium]|nr:D-aminoacylase [Verrucomicrobiae bacterium]